MTFTFIWIEGLIDLRLCLMDLGLTLEKIEKLKNSCQSS